MLVSSTAPVHELIDDGVTGVVVDPTDVEDIARGIERMRNLTHSPAQVSAVTEGRTTDEQAKRMAMLLVQAAASRS